jgi:hypothetical protein
VAVPVSSALFCRLVVVLMRTLAAIAATMIIAMKMISVPMPMFPFLLLYSISFTSFPGYVGILLVTHAFLAVYI